MLVLSFFSTSGRSPLATGSSGSFGFGTCPVGGFALADPSLEIDAFYLSFSMIAKVLYLSANWVFSSMLAEI